jgi:hypothetical protein
MHNHDHFDSRKADCYTDLGRIKEVETLLVSYADPRDRGGEMMLRALVHAKAGDPEAACRAARQALQFSGRSLSLARFRRLDEINWLLEPWASEAFVQRFRSSLARKREVQMSAKGRVT